MAANCAEGGRNERIMDTRSSYGRVKLGAKKRHYNRRGRSSESFKCRWPFGHSKVCPFLLAVPLMTLAVLMNLPFFVLMFAGIPLWCVLAVFYHAFLGIFYNKGGCACCRCDGVDEESLCNCDNWGRDRYEDRL